MLLLRGSPQMVINMRLHCPCVQQHKVVLFFFFFLPNFLHLGSLIRVVLDMISAGQDEGYTS